MNLELRIVDPRIEPNEAVPVQAIVRRRNGSVLARRDLVLTASASPGRCRRVVSVQVGAETLEALLTLDVISAQEEDEVPPAEAFTVQEI